MNLTETPETVTWPDTVYCFVERIGPFQQTAMAAWQQLMKELPALKDQTKLTHRYFARYQIESSTYRAGVGVTAPLGDLPTALRCETFTGGKYARFVLTGPYSDLPAASGRVFERVKELQLQRRDDFCIENYTNDPRTTPESQLITEILIPIR